MLTIGLFTMGQIRGVIIDTYLNPVQLASVFNINKHTHGVSNLDGEFVIEGTIGDSIQIKHINYMGSEFKVKANYNNYFLEPKNHLINEVVVSSEEAFKLFKKSFENIYNKLQDKSIIRGYLRYLKMKGIDTLVLQDIDMDIERQKLRSFDKGEKISIYKIQERTVRDLTAKEGDLNLKKYICPPINQFNWDIFSKSYNFYKVVDTLQIKLYFLSKKINNNNSVHFEVAIQRKDTCLLFFAYTSVGSFSSKKGDKINSTKSYSYTKYCINEGYAFLSETFDKVVFPDSKTKELNIEMSLHYKTYDSKLQELKLRKKGFKINDNTFDSRSITNRYIDKFWINNSELNKVNYDFEYLSNLKIE